MVDNQPRESDLQTKTTADCVSRSVLRVLRVLAFAFAHFAGPICEVGYCVAGPICEVGLCAAGPIAKWDIRELPPQAQLRLVDLVR